jgi:hypothetical protein
MVLKNAWALGAEMRNFLVLALCGFAVACAEDNCTSIEQPAISLEIRDSVSNEIVSLGATAVLRDGAYVDSATFTVNLVAALGFDRAGVYLLTVRKPEYVDWTRSGILVEEDECGPRTVSVVARLRRL